MVFALLPGRPLLVAAPVLVLGALACSTPPAAAGGNVAAGKSIFMSNCAVCHKPDASGGVVLGDAKSADLQSPELEKQYKENDDLLRRAILFGKDEDGEELDKIMPRWNGKLTAAQVDDVLAYLKTVRKH